jgi:hypothetical protein
MDDDYYSGVLWLPTLGGRRVRTPASNPTRSASCISPYVLCRLARARKTSINIGISRQTSAL